MMKKHYPIPHKGRNLMLAVAIASMLPILLLDLLIWTGIAMSYEDDAMVPAVFPIVGIALLICLGIMGWFLLGMFRRKSWARTAWVVICVLWGIIFLIMGVFSSLVGGNLVLVWLFIFTLAYVGFALYLSRNRHIDAFFRKGEAGLEGKIGEIGGEENEK